MIRLSSNFTLFFKFALPVFFTVLYGMVTIFLLFTDVLPFGGQEWVRYTNLAFYLAVLFIMYKSIFQLHRIDCGQDNFIVTNYRTAYRYDYDSIEEFKIEKLFIFQIGRIKFKTKSFFGPSVSFLVDSSNYKKIQEQFNLFQQ